LPVAVIDVGSAAIRLEIAELDARGEVRSLEALQHPVNLGKDTFTTGKLSRATIEECVRVFKGFRQVLRDYGIEGSDRIRAVATSSVREAANRQTLLNRIMIAAHIRVEIIDEAEVNRLTYIALRDSLERLHAVTDVDTLVVEVGAGSTEMLLMQQGHVTLSRTYRLGSLRMRETLETYRTPVSRVTRVLDRHIQRTLDQMRRTIPHEPVQQIIALGGDVRFAAQELTDEDEQSRLVTVPLARFAQFAHSVAAMSVDEVVRTYHLPYQEAETAGPALLTYARLAEVFAVRNLVISRITLRDGLLREMAQHGMWSEHFQEQVVESSMRLGQKYAFEKKHAQHVAMLAITLFHALQSEHELDPRYALLLRVAALLHEIGLYVANQSHHKHSQYLILNSDLFGLSRRDTRLVALIARYHRRAQPKPTHPDYVGLPPDERLVVAKLAAILRVADALDQNHMQQVKRLQFAREPGRLVIRVAGVEDLTLERLALRQKGDMFEETYGLQVELRRNAKPGDNDGR
jgi:exopolyphosphatase/guanosine-5'-triphosphate,3'-diphosphate pyrophosphatase